jgi:hypothetical protein
VNTSKLKVGRLLEVRVAAGFRTTADVDAHFAGIDRALEALPSGQRHVTVTDWRLCTVMSPETAKRLAERIAFYNARTERSAAIASQTSPVAVLQFVRVIREAGLPDRKLFFGEDELRQWLAEVLTPAEQKRLR